MNVKAEQEIIDALVSALVYSKLSDTSFRNFRDYLNRTKQYRLKCILIDNRYLYNSILEKANDVYAKRMMS